MITFLIVIVIGFIAGVIVGILVYRNNVNKAREIELKTQAEIAADKAKAKSLLDILKGR